MDRERVSRGETPEASKQSNRKRRWGPPIPPEQIDFRKTESHNQNHPHSKIAKQQGDLIHEDDLSLKRFKGFRRGRSSSTCRSKHPTFERRHKGTWRCLVCYLWNNNELYQCARCGANEGVDKELKRASVDRDRLAVAYSSFRAGNKSQDRTRRRSASRSGSALRSQDTWPPLFEENGSSYVFDSRSGMFYESNSDCFYDPKSKLYYSNKKQAYFRYDENKIYNNFIQVTEALKPTAANDKDTGDEKPKRIAINIKSSESSLKRPRSGPSSHGVGNATDRRKRDQLSNIKKWEQRTVENGCKSEAKSRGILSKSLERARQAGASAERSMSQQLESNTIVQLPKETSSKNPICVLCKRKFASLEMLHRHEQHSELHRANLMKARDAEAKSKQEPAVSSPPAKGIDQAQKQQSELSYTDRASKRRALYGDTSTVIPNRKISFSLTETQIRTAPIEPAAIIGHNNVGHQLFNKMVAKRSFSGESNAVPESALAASLRKDWERIEAAAKKK